MEGRGAGTETEGESTGLQGRAPPPGGAGSTRLLLWLGVSFLYCAFRGWPCLARSRCFPRHRPVYECAGVL